MYVVSILCVPRVLCVACRVSFVLRVVFCLLCMISALCCRFILPIPLRMLYLFCIACVLWVVWAAGCILRVLCMSTV